MKLWEVIAIKNRQLGKGIMWSSMLNQA